MHGCLMQIDRSGLHDGSGDLGRRRGIRGRGDDDGGRKRRLTEQAHASGQQDRSQRLHIGAKLNVPRLPAGH